MGDAGLGAWEDACSSEPCLRRARVAIKAGDLDGLKKAATEGWHPSIRDLESWFECALSGPSGELMSWILTTFPLAAKKDPIFTVTGERAQKGYGWRCAPMLAAEQFAVKSMGGLLWLRSCVMSAEAGSYFEASLRNDHWRATRNPLLFAEAILSLVSATAANGHLVRNDGSVFKQARSACVAFVEREILDARISGEMLSQLAYVIFKDIRLCQEKKKSWAHFEPLLALVKEPLSTEKLALALSSRENRARERHAAFLEMVNARGRSFLAGERQDPSQPLAEGAIGAMALFGSSMDCFEVALKHGWIAPVPVISEHVVDHPKHLAWRGARLTEEGCVASKMAGRWAKCVAHIKTADLCAEQRDALLAMCDAPDPEAWRMGDPQELLLVKTGTASPLAFLVAACAVAKPSDDAIMLEAKAHRLFAEGHRLLDGILDQDVCAALNGRPWLVAMREREILERSSSPAPAKAQRRSL